MEPKFAIVSLFIEVKFFELETHAYIVNVDYFLLASQILTLTSSAHAHANVVPSFDNRTHPPL